MKRWRQPLAMTQALLWTLGILSLSSPSAAQSDPVVIEPSEEQIALSQQAYQAFVDKDWDKAIDIYQRLLDLGPLNSAYASLGFAYFKAGRCEEAREALDSAEVAPKVSNPPPEVVDELLARYRGQLNTECPGTLILTCSQPGVQLAVDGQAPAACTGNALYLLPGEHSVVAELEGNQETYQVTVAAMETTRLEVFIPGVAVTDKAPDLTEPPQAQGLGSLGWGGVTLAGAGGAVMLAAVALDVTTLSSNVQALREASADNDLTRYDSLKPTVENQQSLVKGMVVSGGALLVVGGALLTIDLLSDSPGEASGDEASLTITPQGAVVHWRW